MDLVHVRIPQFLGLKSETPNGASLSDIALGKTGITLLDCQLRLPPWFPMRPKFHTD